MQFQVGKWKIKSQSLDGEHLDVKEWILPKDIPKEDAINHNSYDIINDLAKLDVIDEGHTSVTDSKKNNKSDNPAKNNIELSNQSFREFMNGYGSSRTENVVTEREESTEHSPKSFHNYPREDIKQERQGKYQRPHILNAFELENPGQYSTVPSAGKQVVNRRYSYPLPSAQHAEHGQHNQQAEHGHHNQQAEHSHYNHHDYRLTNFTDQPWQQTGGNLVR